MAFRRRRGTRGNWLPIDPTYYGESETGTTFFDTVQSLPTSTVSTGEELFHTTVPIAYDRTAEIDTVQTDVTMRDITEGQEYFLDRVVGKVWGSLEQRNDTPESDALDIIFCLALAVLPVQDGAPNTPALPWSNIDPLLAQNVMAPFIWRRTWILSNNLASQVEFFFPNNLGAYGSVMDGGHVDAKTKRRIRTEQRVFLLSTAYKTSPGITYEDFRLAWGFDFRLHGALRRKKNQSTFK